MDKVFKFDSVNEYNKLNSHDTLHPLVTVIDFSKSKPWSWPGGDAKAIKVNYGLYCIVLKEIKCGDLKYGCNYYDYQEGSLVFISPGQIVEVEDFGNNFQPKGYALLFHPDLIHGTSLGKHIHDYSFFSYQSNEALHLAERERKIVLDGFAKIQYELEHAIDNHSKKLIVSNVELFLNYCSRFYERQFITRQKVHQGILEKFENLLNEYFQTTKSQTNGLPSVASCASELNLSPGYFGDLIKKETGKTAQEYIQSKLIDVAKEKISEQSKSVSEIAYELGFKYPQHFTRLFKQKTGHTPNEYRMLN
jgi:AraC family transcriptional regulator, transcriptional activator of pobA